MHPICPISFSSQSLRHSPVHSALSAPRPSVTALAVLLSVPPRPPHLPWAPPVVPDFDSSLHPPALLSAFSRSVLSFAHFIFLLFIYLFVLSFPFSLCAKILYVSNLNPKELPSINRALHSLSNTCPHSWMLFSWMRLMYWAKFKNTYFHPKFTHLLVHRQVRAHYRA